MRTVLVVGLPAAIRSRLEQALKGTVRVEAIIAQRDGGFALEMPPNAAVSFIEHVFVETGEPSSFVVLTLPYARVHADVLDAVALVEEMGAGCIRPKPNDGPWPSRPPVFDNAFQADVLAALITTVREFFSLDAPVAADETDPESEVMSDLLRGLVTHSKMGRNNHSHEDDMWKACGRNLKPNEKNRIVRKLMASGLIDRKKNDSLGGRGWVYWIADVARVRETFEGLAAYLD